jgi:nitronate monooxygenase
MVQANEEDTVVMFQALKNSTRAFRNKVSVQVEEIEAKKGLGLNFQDVAPLVAGSRGRAAEQAGGPDGGIWSAGQVVGSVEDIPTVHQLMMRLVDECEQMI